MENKNNKLTKIKGGKKRFGRRKGVNYFSKTLSLTKEQIEWLDKVPNASKLVRGIIDDLMSAKSEPEVKAISLKRQLDALTEEWDKRNRFLRTYRMDNWDHWKKDDMDQLVYDDEDNPVPLDNDDARIALMVYKEHRKRHRALGEKIGEVKDAILSMQP